MACAVFAVIVCAPAKASGGHAEGVDPRIGTGGAGRTFPGAIVPFDSHAAQVEHGQFREPFDPSFAGYGSDYTEGNAWQYS